MIQVDGLSIAYHGSPLFEKASFSIQPGERCGLVGKNGTGKTTLFKILAGKETPDTGQIAVRKNYVIGVLDQHIFFSKPSLIEEAALGLRKGEEDCLYKAEAILFGLGFKEEDLDRSPSDFSGGYQLRLHLAKLLINEPDCLLLDEPTNYLDIVSIRWFTSFLKKWKGEFVLISHDREFMDNVTTHTMGIHRQKVRKIKGGTVAFYEQLLQQEDIHERTRQNVEKKRANIQEFIDKFGAKASKAGQAQSRQKLLGRIPTLEKLKHLDNLDFSFNEASFPGKLMFTAENLSFSYDKKNSLIHDLSLLLEKGERAAIIGKNGRGKSTFLRLLAQELLPDGGSLKSSDNLRIGYFGQTNIDRLHPKHTVEEEIAAANPKLNMTQIRGICGLMMFSSDKATKQVSVLSGGERSRVLLGKIIATPCNLLLLDEPTHHLDMESIEALIDAMEDFEGGVIVVTHSELLLKRLALNKIVICHEGKQELFLGTYEEFLEDGGWNDESEASPKKAEKKQKLQRNLEKSADGKTLAKTARQTEELITKLEIEQEKTNKFLIQASEGGDRGKVQQLTQERVKRQQEIDKLFAMLEELN